MSGILFFDELPLFLRNIANLKKLKEGVEWVVCSKQVSVNSFQYAVVIINKRLAKDDKKLFDGPTAQHRTLRRNYFFLLGKGT
jgi:hypothetical protein